MIAIGLELENEKSGIDPFAKQEVNQERNDNHRDGHVAKQAVPFVYQRQ